MMITQYWAVFLFIIFMSIAEPIWSPIYNKYTLEFTQKGDEGIFFGLATIPMFLAKLVTGFLSGELLHRYCPVPGPELAPNGCGHGRLIWMIIGCITVSSPLLLLATQRWTWLRPMTTKEFERLADEFDMIPLTDADDDMDRVFDGILDDPVRGPFGGDEGAEGAGTAVIDVCAPTGFTSTVPDDFL